MFKVIKEFFLGKPETKAEDAPYKVETPAEVQPIVEVKADPVAVALDLEPMELSASAEPAKKPRKPRTPKVAEKAVKPAKKAAVKKPAAMKAPAKRGPKKAK